MRVEFCGPPGAGKSTIMRACGRKKPKRLEPAPSERCEFLAFVRDCYRGVQRKHDGATVTTRQYRRAMAADALGKACWFSELLVQRGLSLALARPGELDLVRRYYELMPPPWLTVFVTGAPELIIERNRRRFAENGKDDRSVSVPYLCEVTDLAIRAARGRVLVLMASAPVEKNAARVMRAVG